MATFRDFLQHAADSERFGDSPESDFVEDALRDGGLVEPTKWPDLKTYMIWHRGACSAAVKAAKKVFETWEDDSAETHPGN